MPDVTPELPDPIVVHGQQPQVYSPSPPPGVPPPRRRFEDLKDYSGEWTILVIAILTWASTFMTEIAVIESWDEVLTPKMVGVHLGQLFGMIVSVLAAKRLR